MILDKREQLVLKLTPVGSAIKKLDSSNNDVLIKRYIGVAETFEIGVPVKAVGVVSNDVVFDNVVRDESDAAQSYIFERAEAPPTVSTANGSVTSFGTTLYNTPGSASNRGRMLPDAEPIAYAAFSTTQTGTIPTGGRGDTHTLDLAEVTGAAKVALRLRWLTTDVGSAENIATSLSSADTYAASAFESDHVNLVPGTVVMTLPTGAGTLTDDGRGNLIGDGFGVIDYKTGAWYAEFDTPQSGTVTANYQYNCTYGRLNAEIAWDDVNQ